MNGKRETFRYSRYFLALIALRTYIAIKTMRKTVITELNQEKKSINSINYPFV